MVTAVSLLPAVPSCGCPKVKGAGALAANEGAVVVGAVPAAGLPSRPEPKMPDDDPEPNRDWVGTAGFAEETAGAEEVDVSEGLETAGADRPKPKMGEATEIVFLIKER